MLFYYLVMKVEHCKRKNCFNLFVVGRKTQYCSVRCSDIQGKADWKKRNPEKVRQQDNERRKFRYANEEGYAEKKKQEVNSRWHSKSPEEKKQIKKIERQKRVETHGIEPHREYMREYNNDRNANDLDFRLRGSLRARVRGAVKNQGGDKALKTIELIGCSIDHLRHHLESLWTEGMNWDNYGFGEGKWNIDHIIPCASFDLTDPEQQKQCFHWTNLQPLWQPENQSKGDKILVST